jgi:hypothetical protein
VPTFTRLKIDGEENRYIYVGFFMHYQTVMSKKTLEGHY